MTTAQFQASDPAYSVWVAASAGTGKTTVLTSRVLRLLLSGTNPGKILCLTYTNAGAAEMECRIKAKLCRWVTLSDSELNTELEKLTGNAPDDKTITRARKLFLETLDTPDGIKIQTIHSFCQSLMRRFPLEANVVPHFKIMDGKTEKELLKEAQVRLLSDKEKYTPEIASAVKNIFWRIREGTFSEVIKDIINDRSKLQKATKQAGSLEGLKSAIFNLLGAEEGVDEDEVLRRAVAEGSFDRGALLSAGRELIGTSPDFIKIGNAILKWLEQDEAGRKAGFEDYKLAFLTQSNELRKKLAPAKSKTPPEPLLNEQERVYKVVGDIKKARVATLSSSILDIAHTLLDGYGHLKDGKACLDYTDLIMKAENLLASSDSAPWVLYKLDGGIDHLLVDEAQDTSPEQWAIIDALCAEFFAGSGARDVERTIFVVGDEKQSIFSFQGAAPQIFNQMQEKFKRRVDSAGKKWKPVSLDESFRSSPVILQLVDEVRKGEGLWAMGQGKKENDSPSPFSPCPSPHIAFHKEMYGRIELWPLIEPEKKEAAAGWVMPLEYLEKHDVKKILAEKIADEIKGWLDSGRILESEGRPVQAGDIMILLRRRKDIADNIISSLKKRKIPVAGHDRLVITQHLAVMDLIALGNFLLLPEDNLSLACALKSPLLGFSDDDLFKIAYGREHKSLWQSLKEQAQTSPKFSAAADYLSGLLGKVDFFTPFALYCHVLEALSGRKQLISRLGEEINDPVDEFLSLALSYEQSHPPSLQGFLSWLASGESEIKRDMEQGGSGTVRVITVHGSKGLEAPIVIIPDTTSVPDSKNTRILWHESNLMLWPGNSENAEEICKSIKQRKIAEEKAEYNRLLYVALTRAKSELYICGWAGRKKISEDCWYESVKAAMGKIATQDADDILRISGGIPKKQEVTQQETNPIDIVLPDYFLAPPQAEPTPTNPLTPSKIEERKASDAGSLSSRQRILEGKIIHSLLEFLPDITASQRLETGRAFLMQKFTSLPELCDVDLLLNNLISILNMDGLKDVFGQNSRAEVPVVGIVGNVVVSGRIDRLCVLSDKVIILDYKTGRTPPKSVQEISPEYIKQMAAYCDIMRQIYPDKNIEAYLIWTEGAKLFRLPGNALKYRKKSAASA